MNENELSRANKNAEAPAEQEEQAPKKKIKVWVIALISVGVLAIASTVVFLLYGAHSNAPNMAISPPPEVVSNNGSENSEPSATPEETNLPIVSYSPTTGRGVTNSDKEYRPMCVMVDNEMRALPQSGVGSADVFYEMYIEGGETRIMAVFNDVIPQQIGPVRSARICFLEIVEEWQALYVHVGGSPAKNESNAFNRMREMKARGTLPAEEDGNRPSSLIARNPERRAPNNDYFDGPKMTERYKDLPISPERPLPFVTNGELKDGGQDCKEITIKYRGSYSVGYKYNEATGNYARFVGENPYVDAADGKQVTVENLIIQQAKTSMYDFQHVKIDLIGTGDCTVIRNGKAIEGTWEKTDVGSRTVFKDKSGSEIDLKPGVTFIQVVNPVAGGAPITGVTMQ